MTNYVLQPKYPTEITIGKTYTMVGNTAPIPVSFVNMNNRAADKAVLAMAYLGLTKPDGPAGVGVGPNRNDAPIFEEFAQQVICGEKINKDLRFRAHHRVRKYARQLDNCKFAGVIFDDSRSPDVLVEQLNNHLESYQSTKRLETELQEVMGYGDW